ncbi:MAG: TAT-variant-translocated molybdopterin oxidoreductase [Pyrinomonadaceae bacterium]
MPTHDEQTKINESPSAHNRGRAYWRSLEELCADENFAELLRREYPRQAALMDDALDRRNFLKLMAASLALAGATACGVHQAPEKIVPYVRQPEEIILGKSLYYATAMPLSGYATGLLVESHEGRPTKIEGNPDHPASLGATDHFAQASVLTLYDPERSQTVMRGGDISSWESFLADFRKALANQRARGGAGFRLLTETITSPTLADQLQTLLKDFPNAVWHQYEPAARDNVREGARLAFGEYVETIYRFDKANVVLALDADFLSSGAGSLRYARDFIAKRRVRDASRTMNRLYAIESTPTNTGTMADHRLPLKASEVESFAHAVAAQLGIQHGEQTVNPQSAIRNPQWITALAVDLQRNRGACLVVAGDYQTPQVHALAHAMNNALGNVGNTVLYVDSIEANPTNQLASLRSLISEMDDGRVETLVIFGGNPVYSAPVDFHFAESLQKVPLRVHHSLYYDETSALCQWHIPETHFLETWSDARAFDGTVSIIQPLIAPLYEGRSAHEFLAAFSNEKSGYDILRDYWRNKFVGGRTKTQTINTPNNTPNSAPNAHGANASTATASTNNAPSSNTANQSNDFEQAWQQALRDGVVPNTVSQQKPVTLKTDWLTAPAQTAAGQANAERQASDSANTPLEIIFRPDPNIYDGRFANNGWLQELPKPLTKLTWDNAALMSPATARRFNLSNEVNESGGSHGGLHADVVELRFNGRMIRAPVFIAPGHADNCVTVHLGYGRTRVGHVGTNAGFNAYAIRTSDALWFGGGLGIHPTGARYSLACTQQHHSMEGRDIVRSATLDEYRAHPDFAKREADDPQKPLSMFPEWKYEGHAWGMAIDTGSCVGCNACVVACQAENNIPIVGKEEVLRAREMHWLRIDRYYAGDERNPETFHQPVMCQHCENAPCELVCPTEATAHSDEGLNMMTYNRCVGTRYCSNNCPYKVRRFNFFQYQDFDAPPVVQLQRNPNVTVRSRGVMEKCTYCVQRIQHAKIEAEKDGRTVRDGEIVTACQSVCPTEAIVFGDINDKNSRVSKLKAEPTNYGLLAELNTKPRTTYLATIRNPNPEIKTE